MLQAIADPAAKSIYACNKSFRPCVLPMRSKEVAWNFSADMDLVETRGHCWCLGQSTAGSLTRKLYGNGHPAWYPSASRCRPSQVRHT